MCTDEIGRLDEVVDLMLTDRERMADAIREDVEEMTKRQRDAAKRLRVLLTK